MRYRVRPSYFFRDTWIVVELASKKVIAQFDSLFDARRVARELNSPWVVR